MGSGYRVSVIAFVVIVVLGLSAGRVPVKANQVLVSSETDKVVYRFDEATGEFRGVFGGTEFVTGGPRGIGYDEASNKLYISQYFSGIIRKYSGYDFAYQGTLINAGQPWEFVDTAFMPDGKVYQSKFDVVSLTNCVQRYLTNGTLDMVIGEGLIWGQCCLAWGPDDGLLYVSSPFTNAIKVFNPSDGSLVNTIDTAPDDPRGLGIIGRNLYYSSYTNNKVRIYNLDAHWFIDLVAINGPWDMDVRDDHLYVASVVDNCVYRINPLGGLITNQYSDSTMQSSSAFYLAVIPDPPAELLVSSLTDKAVYKYDEVTGTFDGTFGGTEFVSNGPTGIGHDATGNTLYIAEQLGGIVRKYDATSYSYLGTLINAGQQWEFFDTKVMPDRKVYQGKYDQISTLTSVPRYLRDGTLDMTIGEGANAGQPGLAWGPDNMLYVSCPFISAIKVYDPSNGSLVSTINTAPDDPRCLGFIGDKLYYSCYSSNKVRSYDLNSLVFSDVVTINTPWGLAVRGGDVYVASTGDVCAYKVNADRGQIMKTYADAGMRSTFYLDIVPDPPPPVQINADAAVYFNQTADDMARLRSYYQFSSYDCGPTLSMLQPLRDIGLSRLRRAVGFDDGYCIWERDAQGNMIRLIGITPFLEGVLNYADDLGATLHMMLGYGGGQDYPPDVRPPGSTGPLTDQQGLVFQRYVKEFVKYIMVTRGYSTASWAVGLEPDIRTPNPGSLANYDEYFSAYKHTSIAMASLQTELGLNITVMGPEITPYTWLYGAFNWMQRFLQDCGTQSLKLDACSLHFYGNNALLNEKDGREWWCGDYCYPPLSTMLSQTAGWQQQYMPQAKTWITEWGTNAYGATNEPSAILNANQVAAAFAPGFMMQCLDSNVEKAMYLVITDCYDVGGNIWGFPSMFANGVPYPQIVPKAPYNVFRMFGKMGDNRIYAFGGSADIGVLASRDASKAAVLVWNYHPRSYQDGSTWVESGLTRQVNVGISNTGFLGSSVKFKRYLVDETHSNAYGNFIRSEPLDMRTHLQCVEEGVLANGGTITRSFDLGPSSVSLLVFSVVDGKDEVLVSSDPDKRVYRFDEETGYLFGTFGTEFVSGAPKGIGHDVAGNTLYIAEYWGGIIRKYNATNYSYLGTLINAGQSWEFVDTAFMPDGKVYQSKYDAVSLTNCVQRYLTNGTLDTTIGEGLISGQACLAWGPDGMLYVSSPFTNTIKVFDPSDGSLVRSIGDATPWLMDGPRGLGFIGRKLYFARYGLYVGGAVMSYDLDTQAIDLVASVNTPWDLAVRGGNLYVVSTGDKCVYRVDPIGQIKITQTYADATMNGPSYLYATPVAKDTVPPTGSISINAGVTYCTSTSVTLTLSASDDGSGVSQMRFRNGGDTSWSSWETYATSKAWTLTSGDGTKTVYAQFKDVAGNVCSAYTDTIILDTTLPVPGTCTPPASVTTSTIGVPYSGASDGGSGLKQVELWYKKETGGTWTNSGLTKTAGADTFTFTPSSGSGRYYFDLVAEDNAGNRSASASGNGDGVTIFKLWWSDGFESGNFTAGGWTNSGCNITSNYKYSGTYSAVFNYTDSLTKLYSTVGKSDIKVEYARYTRTMETDDHFISEWSTNGTTWYTLEDLTGNSAWTVKIYQLPSGADNQSGFRIRFRTSHNGSLDYAYLDDVKIIGL